MLRLYLIEKKKLRPKMDRAYSEKVPEKSSILKNRIIVFYMFGIIISFQKSIGCGPLLKNFNILRVFKSPFSFFNFLRETVNKNGYSINSNWMPCSYSNLKALNINCFLSEPNYFFPKMKQFVPETKPKSFLRNFHNDN